MHNSRKARIAKAYIAVFVCLAVKAVHVELVGDLTSEYFLGALKRFFASRGKANCMFSDNGRNFVGAEREMRKQFQQLSRDARIYAYLAQENIEWKFIPPHAPQFGGLWEAAVKSFKFHLRRVVGQAILTYEEMSTYLALIESCLNSRPLCPLSSDPNDLSPLTPGHFLTGASLSTIPHREVTGVKMSSLSSWHRVEHMFQCFWVRWSRKYLSILQGRKKWLRAERNLEVGRLVLVKDEGLRPLRWPLGRIIATHPGRDNLTRVVTLKTASGLIKRPISKVYPLPEDKPDGVST